MIITDGNQDLGRAMRWHRLILALLALVAGGAAPVQAQDDASSQPGSEQAVPDHWPRCPADLPDRYSVQALRHERNDDRLFCAAIDVARNDDPLALRVLSAVMSEPPFVARLGPPGHPAQDWQALRLVAVLRALAANESTAATRLCAAWHTEPTLLQDAARALAVRHTLSVCAPSASAPPAPKPASMDVTEPLADTVERLVPSVVRVTALRLQAGEERASESVFGNGLLIDASGLPAANYHVIKNASAVHVTFANHDDYQVSIVGTDPVSDIALLRINFAIPANTVDRVLATLRRGQRVDYPLLGADLRAVTYARAEMAHYRGVDGTGRKRVTGAWGEGIVVVRDGQVQQLPVLLDVLR